MATRTVTISVIGVSGKESVKGLKGVGKSLLCNRFVRGNYDDFFPDHCSVLSQTDFGGSPVINNDHWLYWGERLIEYDESGARVNLRVIEQTEFLDDETYEPIAGPSTSENYSKRSCRTKLESRDKLMYIQKEQLGLEAEFPQQILPDGKCQIDCFIYVFDSSRVEGRSFNAQCNSASVILSNAIKSKKPVVLALSQCDIMDEEARKSLQILLNKKDLKSSHITVIEVSSVMNVNIDELFIIAANSSLKGKTRLKVLPYLEAVKFTNERNRNAKIAFTRLLHVLLPIESWPTQRLSWTRLLSDRALDRQPDYCTFVKIFGSAAARKAYDQHVNEAREHWMAARLRALLPNLPRVFAALLDKSDIANLSWHEANRRVHSHALFDEFFQPLGVLGKQLDPVSPYGYQEKFRENTIIDHRIPAEILLRHEARQAFEAYQQAVEAEHRKERLEEDFEFLLAETAQVTPGKPLQDVCIFLQGYCAYEALPPSQASLVYDRFQHELVKKAEIEFSECLLEHIEIFADLARTWKKDNYYERNYNLSERDLEGIKEYLQDDYRFRHLSRLFELRDKMIHQFATFVANPQIRDCPAMQRCIDVSLHEITSQFFQRKRMNSHSLAHIVDIVVHGEISMVAQFITEIKTLLRNDSFLCSSGQATIRCHTEVEGHSNIRPKTELYLIDSVTALESAREASNRCQSVSSTNPLPPVFVVVCDPSHYDLLPFLHQQGAILAEATEGIFIGSGTNGSEDSQWSRGSDSSSIFGRDQLFRICDTVCSTQLDGRQGEMRIQTSILCGDPYSIECLLGSMFSGDPEVLRAVVNPNLLGSGIIPLDTCSTSSSRYIRVDLKLGSYHSWLTARSTSPTHGHIVVYSARRAASFAHARAAICRVLDDGCRTVTGKAILLVAVADIQDYFSDEETNLLLTEGNELATSIGAAFITLSPDSATNTSQSVEFVKFFDRLQGMVPLFKPNSLERIKRNSDGYAVLKEFKSGQQKVDGNLYITHKTSCSAGTLLSESSNSRESTLSTGVARSPRTESAISTPILRSSASAITLCNSSVSTRPRRRAAPGKIPLRLPLMKEPIPAPLATPEMVEFAPEYSIVQDALTDDNHIYATLDFASATKDDQKSVTSSEKSNSSGKKDKKRPLRSRMFSNHSNSTEPSSSPSVSAPSGSQPSSAGSSVRDNVSVVQVGDVISTTFTHHSSSSPLLNSQTTINSDAASTLFIPPVTPIRPKIAPKPMHLIANLHAKPTRSKTMDIISKDAIVKGQQLAGNGLKKSSSIKMVGLRQSLSAESFAELIAEKKKKREFGGSKFVRKVATSFRFKKIPPTPISEKNTPSFEDVPKNSLVISLPIKGSRSLPQSPQIERKNGQKKITSMASSEKASTTFFWLPSRSPKRAHKTLNDTLQGVIGLNDTIESLSEKAGGLPLFLTRCINFIEKEGGLEMEGLYRIPGNQAQLTELEKTFKEKGDIDLVRLQMPVHVVATAVKNFFSCLPEPLVPTELHEEILESVEKNEPSNNLQVLMSRLSEANRNVMIYFTHHLEKVAASPHTAMDVKNLSKVWFPTLFRPQFDDFDAMSCGMTKFQQATEAILKNCNDIFHIPKTE